MALEHGIKCAILVNRSMTVKIESSPSMGGKSVIKSIEMDDHADPVVGEVEAVHTSDDGLFWIEHRCHKS